VWLRGLLGPPPGYGLAYCDWSAQEIGLGGALAGCEAQMADYSTGDPYIAFARRGRLVPPDATKDSHPLIRDRCKNLVLGLNYGMSDFGLAQRLEISTSEAHWLADQHRTAYLRQSGYIERVVHTGALGHTLHSVFGFNRHIETGSDFNPRSLRNWPMQTNGAEMMRIATVMGIHARLVIVALVHDAILIMAPLDRLDEDAAKMSGIMVRASEIVCGGFRLRVKPTMVRYPDRYQDDRGVEMWDRAMAVLHRLETERGRQSGGTDEDPDEDEDDAGDGQEGLAAFVGKWA
jgi:hypothetical protein